MSTKVTNQNSNFWTWEYQLCVIIIARDQVCAICYFLMMLLRVNRLARCRHQLLLQTTRRLVGGLDHPEYYNLQINEIFELLPRAHQAQPDLQLRLDR